MPIEETATRRWQRLDAALETLIDLPLAKRAAAIDRLAADDDTLRAELTRLADALDPSSSRSGRCPRRKVLSFTTNKKDVFAERLRLPGRQPRWLDFECPLPGVAFRTPQLPRWLGGHGPSDRRG